VDGTSTSRSGWTLSEQALARFLACLDSDRDRAGEKFESLRVMLTRFFDWRGAYFPEECADEAMNRVIRKIDEGQSIEDVPTFCYGVARLVLLEKQMGSRSQTSCARHPSPTADRSSR
jgi:hypothetical protein